ncbi:hypothetical protein CR162_06170 [Pseudoroseomonas rhizosphaerae]|uniref:Ancillary SecYEG translocon subunit/Cell division coordinator CpoB TPR domain-containing protein n=1 Tax=Teichococcus rhizosphaerae TaxID=1335062 RepID=A0A2C7A740_9PROT|nr:tetratricopeptide repeat protein [Pseudoroseomonas rhizosphaerae]PHK95918.1 hypothetical protein CR162_06170 [Pseudoroseomonas rhizosphaerae]
MPDIFDEVQEELRAERARQLGMRYGGMLAGVALLVLAGLGGWQGWQWYEQRQNSQAALTFLEAHRAAEAPGADLKAVGDRFAALANDSPAGYRTLSLLRAAALKAETGDRAAALAMWDRVASDGGTPQLYRDLASLMWALHGMDSQDPALLAARLDPLAQAGSQAAGSQAAGSQAAGSQAAGSPWRASARELRALLAIRRGETAEARRDLEALAADVTAPRGLRDRAGRLAAGLGG